MNNSIITSENKKIPRPPLPGEILDVNNSAISKNINLNNLNHEMGHLAQDGLLNSKLYKKINLTTKENSPDQKYVGNILETDTRIRSMYRDLGELFDPQKEVFGRKHLEILREKLSRGKLSNDTKDLFDHYDDITLVKLANRLPAI